MFLKLFPKWWYFKIFFCTGSVWTGATELHRNYDILFLLSLFWCCCQAFVSSIFFLLFFHCWDAEVQEGDTNIPLPRNTGQLPLSRGNVSEDTESLSKYWPYWETGVSSQWYVPRQISRRTHPEGIRSDAWTSHCDCFQSREAMALLQTPCELLTLSLRLSQSVKSSFFNNFHQELSFLHNNRLEQCLCYWGRDPD